LEDTEAKHERLTLTRLTVYPIKSCAGNELSRSVVKRLSPLPGDREFLFVDHTGTFLTQRAKEARQGNGGLGCPRMALIKAELTPGPGGGSRTLRLSTPGMETVDAEEKRDPPCEVDIWQQCAAGVEQAGAFAEFFRQVTGVDGRLISNHDAAASSAAARSGDWAKSRAEFAAALKELFPVALASASERGRPPPFDDGGTIHLVTEASMDELNRRVAAAGLKGGTGLTLDVSRFRANFVVGGSVLSECAAGLDALSYTLAAAGGAAASPSAPSAPSASSASASASAASASASQGSRSGAAPLPPHAEDDWLELRIGQVRFRVERHCTRCSQILVDPDTGERDRANWLARVLAKYRSGPADAGCAPGADQAGTKFGLYVTPLDDGEVCVGDEVVVTRRKRTALAGELGSSITVDS
jgi:uncharacterized protein YcbX